MKIVKMRVGKVLDLTTNELLYMGRKISYPDAR